MTHALWMIPQSILLEIRPFNRPRRFFYELAADFNLLYFGFDAESDESDNFELALEDLKTLSIRPFGNLIESSVFLRDARTPSRILRPHQHTLESTYPQRDPHSRRAIKYCVDKKANICWPN